jgi:parallel beta-helix repeat protein
MALPFMRAALVALLISSPSLLSAKTIRVDPGANAQERLQEALITAQPGDVVELGAGQFDLTDGLSLDVNAVTLKGAGEEKSILDFKGQLGAGEGLLVTSDDVVLRDFGVRDTKGDGIKSKGADRIVYYRLAVIWSGGPKETNGAYGIYPVESRDVLIDDVMVSGASDAGIYVGQSRNIIVRNSVVSQNVAGIEIENSYDADVLNNTASGNTGGILVFDLPNLPQMGGRNVRIANNVVVENNTPNFAPKGNIVANVPAGTGIMVMANSNVQIVNNQIENNDTSNVMITSYRFPFTDPKYDPTPRGVFVDRNTMGSAGTNPGLPGGDMLAKMFGGAIPPVLWDGSGSAVVRGTVQIHRPAKNGTKVNPDGSVVGKPISVLSLGLKDPKLPTEQAQPSLVDISNGAAPAPLKPIILPASMEAVIKDAKGGKGSKAKK